MNALIQLKKATPPFLFVFVLACFVLFPTAEAVVPPPDGGYPGGNTAEGQNALFNLTTGVRNSADGFFALLHDTTGSDNTAIGALALLTNRDGIANTAVGSRALENNTPSFTLQTGSHNTALGFQALRSNTQGFENTALASQALYSNTIGINNTATGAQALFTNTTGGSNTATGAFVLFSNTIGFNNTAVGFRALHDNERGTDNTAIGQNALFTNRDGRFNVAVGATALQNNFSGSTNTATGYGALGSGNAGSFNTASGYLAGSAAADYNTAIGVRALQHNTGFGNVATGANALLQNVGGDFNVALGAFALLQNVGGDFNVALGAFAGGTTLGNWNIEIGNAGTSSESNTVRIGTAFDANSGNGQNRAFMAGIRGVTTGIDDAIPVLIDSAGQLGTGTSARRFKTEIKPMDDASEAIFRLKPVTFRYKTATKATPQFGLIAEEVAEVNPDLVVRDKNGEIYTVRYDAVNAMLLNEFLKEHRTVQEQKATIAQLEKGMETVIARLEEQASQIQKVGAQIELSKAVGQTALNNP